jgi:hypothetical protein
MTLILLYAVFSLLKRVLCTTIEFLSLLKSNLLVFSYRFTYLIVSVVLIKRDLTRTFRHDFLMFNFSINQPEDILAYLEKCRL